MRGSALARGKWDEARNDGTYLSETIDKVLRGTAQTYDWNRHRGAANDTGPAEPPRFVQSLLTSAEFAAIDARPVYLVKNCIVQGQPGVVGGREKVGKTNISVDLVVSLGSGTKFLNHFPTRRSRVGFWCGESGKSKVQGVARRICLNRELILEDLDIFWGFDLPKLSRLTDLGAMAQLCEEKKLDVVVVDPLYLSLDTEGQSSSIFGMGALLEPLSSISRAGTTVILVHHFRKNSDKENPEPCPLSELSQAGVAESARWWILLQRRSEYANDGRHELYCRIGGSEGHSSLWAMDVNEGKQTTPDGDEVLTDWQTDLRSVSDVRTEAKQAREDRRAAELEKKDSEYRRRLWDVIQQFPEGDTARQLRTAAAMNPENFNRAVMFLKKEGRIEEFEITKNRKILPRTKAQKMTSGTSGTSGTITGTVPVNEWNGTRNYRCIVPFHSFCSGSRGTERRKAVPVNSTWQSRHNPTPTRPPAPRPAASDSSRPERLEKCSQIGNRHPATGVNGSD